MSSGQPVVLCVDDEPQILAGLERHLREHFSVLAARSGTAALELLARNSDVAVILSDMRMPQMDGPAFLGRARALQPHAVRILLTGHADLDAAVRAINEGEIFRFITKPCSFERLMATLRDGQRQYELVIAEKTLLQRTVLGCIKALVDMMAFVSPAAMGRAVRIKRRVAAMAHELDVERAWVVEAAALFSQVGTLCLPEEMLEKLESAVPMSETECEQMRSAMQAASALIARVPRLGAVGNLLDRITRIEAQKPLDGIDRTHAELLQLATELDRLEESGVVPAEAVTRAAATREYSPRVLEAASRHITQTQEMLRRSEVPLHGLQLGMILADDVRTQRGVLIAARGCEVTPGFLEKMRNFARHWEGIRFAVLVPRREAPQSTGKPTS